MTVELYADGSCIGGAFGGWGCVVLADDIVHRGYGGACNSTNNKMELEACIRGLQYIKIKGYHKAQSIIIYSDSAYVVNAFIDNWIAKWKVNKWLNSKKEPVANKVQWLQLIDLVNSFKYVEFRKVKGHAGNKWNEEADKLACKGSEKMKRKKGMRK